MDTRTSTPDTDASRAADLPEILSDEEMRSRAAAYAQRVYEQQLEAYRAQREQTLAARQAQSEYLRQMREYEQACRDFYARTQTTLRIDPDTGEQIYVNSASPAESVPAAPEEPAQTQNFSAVPAQASAFAADAETESVPAPAETPDAAEFSAEFPPQEEIFSEEPPSDSADVQPSDVQPSDAPGEEAPPESEPDAPADVPEAPSRAELPRAETRRRRRSGGSGFPLLSALLVVVCVAALAAEGYILFSDDPRFETQRNSFFGAIGWDNARTDLNGAGPTTAAPEADAVSDEDAEEKADGNAAGEADVPADEEEDFSSDAADE